MKWLLDYYPKKEVKRKKIPWKSKVENNDSRNESDVMGMQNLLEYSTQMESCLSSHFLSWASYLKTSISIFRMSEHPWKARHLFCKWWKRHRKKKKHYKWYIYFFFLFYWTTGRIANRKDNIFAVCVNDVKKDDILNVVSLNDATMYASI